MQNKCLTKGGCCGTIVRQQHASLWLFFKSVSTTNYIPATPSELDQRPLSKQESTFQGYNSRSGHFSRTLTPLEPVLIPLLLSLCLCQAVAASRWPPQTAAISHTQPSHTSSHLTQTAASSHSYTLPPLEPALMPCSHSCCVRLCTCSPARVVRTSPYRCSLLMLLIDAPY